MHATRRMTILVAAVLALGPQLLAQTDTDTVLRSLLAEVRALRLTMQRASLLGLRGNLLVERIRTAQSRATSTQNQLDEVRQQITSMEQERQRFASTIEELEEKIRTEYDSEVLERFKRELDQYENATEMFSGRVEALRRNEAELLTRLDEDRARLDGLEAAFDDLLKEVEETLESTD